MVCLAVVLGMLPAGCGKRDEEAEIRRLIREGASLAEKHDAGGLMKLATEDFRALPGEADKREVKGVLLYAFTRYRQFRIIHPPAAIHVQAGGEAASARFPFLIVQKDQSLPDLKGLLEDPEEWAAQLGDKADLFRLDLELVRAEGNWRVRRAHLEGFRGLGFGS
jgi:hypothetical protein